VLQTHLARSTLGKGFHRSINKHHHTIVEAIEAGDADRAASEMYAHLVFLRPAYERAWRHAAAMRKRASSSLAPGQWAARSQASEFS
jgi:DNA-binding GntR family transcriptional regulator